jgi:hypothetical protein
VPTADVFWDGENSTNTTTMTTAIMDAGTHLSSAAGSWVFVGSAANLTVSTSAQKGFGTRQVSVASTLYTDSSGTRGMRQDHSARRAASPSISRGRRPRHLTRCRWASSSAHPSPSWTSRATRSSVSRTAAPRASQRSTAELRLGIQSHEPRERRQRARAGPVAATEHLVLDHDSVRLHERRRADAHLRRLVEPDRLRLRDVAGRRPAASEADAHCILRRRLPIARLH